MHRVFVTGCSRSGTTLLQSILAAHPGLLGLPETQFFIDLAGNQTYRATGQLSPSWWRVLIREVLIRSGRACMVPQNRVNALAEHFGVSAPTLPADGIRGTGGAFVAFLDSLATGRDGWVEKSPKHFGFTDVIRRAVDSPRFVHIVRDGTSNVASIMDNAAKYEPWAKRFPSPDDAVAMWNRANAVARRESRRPDTLVVQYEQLAESPEPVTQRVCDFLGIDYQPAMLAYRGEATQQVVYAHEPWKANVAQTIAKARSKFADVFDEPTQERIRAALADGGSSEWARMDL